MLKLQTIQDNIAKLSQNLKKKKENKIKTPNKKHELARCGGTHYNPNTHKAKAEP